MWYENITPMVLTILYLRLSDEYQDKYPKPIKITSKGQNLTDADLPCVYIQELSTMELGRELEPGEICAIQADYQIEVYSNMSQDEAKKIAGSVTQVMKDLGFGVMVLPYPVNMNGIYRVVSRFRRAIGSDDVDAIFNDNDEPSEDV